MTSSRVYLWPGTTTPKSRGVAKASFSQLCDRPLGATDFVSLARRYHTLFVTGLPQLSLKDRDLARRFITLVDQLYNEKAICFIQAEVPLDRLFVGTADGAGGAARAESFEGLEFEGEAGKATELNPIGVTANSLAASAAGADTASVSADSRKLLARGRDTLFTGEDEVFAFRRAISRLREMGSVEYERAHAALRLGAFASSSAAESPSARAGPQCPHAAHC